MTVASIALFVSLGGTSIAAIDYARNAGAVDGRSAVRSKASLKRAAGKLVATKRSGPNRGKIPARFLALPAQPASFGSYVPVTDNATGSPSPLGGVPEVGQFSASCADQSNRPGVEDPVTRLSFNNTSGTAINFMRQIGSGDAQVIAQLPGTVETFNIPGANRFTLHAQRGLTNLLVEGVVRQDGAGTPDAKCLVYGVTFRVSS
jgi:hypothetical protein